MGDKLERFSQPQAEQLKREMMLFVQQLMNK